MGTSSAPQSVIQFTIPLLISENGLCSVEHLFSRQGFKSNTLAAARFYFGDGLCPGLIFSLLNFPSMVL
jgi:hypothetical protein